MVKSCKKIKRKPPKNCTLLFYHTIFKPAGSGTLEPHQTEKDTFLGQRNAETEKRSWCFFAVNKHNCKYLKQTYWKGWHLFKIKLSDNQTNVFVQRTALIENVNVLQYLLFTILSLTWWLEYIRIHLGLLGNSIKLWNKPEGYFLTIEPKTFIISVL